MKATYIVGASGAAKEVFLLIKSINNVKSCFNFKGFIDLKPKEKTLKIGKTFYPILDEDDFIKNQKESCAIVFAIGFPKQLNFAIKKYLDNSNFEFPNLIHSSVELDESVSLGKGNLICNGAILTVDISIGDFNNINRGVHIGHDIGMGNCNIINPCAVISGGVKISNNNLIGTNATVLQYLNIDSNNTIGAGAVLTKSISNNITTMGIPAKPITND